jgi:GNAT superfamily N-acetyltransferase
MPPMSAASDIQIRPATADDVPVILAFIRELADYEKLSHTVVATEPALRESLFGPRPYAEVRLALLDGQPAGFALFFHNFSTFLGRPGLYLEDLFVRPPFRSQGVGRALLKELAALAVARRCGRLEWSVLDWNDPAIQFYRKLGAQPLNDWTIFRVTGPALTALADKDHP